MSFISVNKTFEASFKKNWDRPAISNYQGATYHYRDLARKIAKLHILFEECGLEKGDKFTFTYECPAGMCPRVMEQVYTWCEVIRCGGDFTYRGSKEKYGMNLVCPCKSIHFHLKATPINRDENGNALPNHPRPED